MGRHSSGEQNYSIAKGPLYAVLALLLVIGAVFVWLNLKSDNTSDHNAANSQCSKGDLNLIVATDPANVGQVQKLLEAYGNSSPVVKDYCVRPQLTVQGSQNVVDALGTENTHGINVLPGVWVPADSVFVDRAKQQTRVAVEDPKVWMQPTKAGIATNEAKADELSKLTWQQLGDKKIATPGDSDAALSSIVNDALTGGVSAATMRAGLGTQYTSDGILGQISSGELDIDGVAATAPMLSMAGQGLKLVTPEGSPELNAPIVTFGSGGPINENTARASADFVKFAENSDLTNSDNHESSMTESALELLPVLSGIKTDPYAAPNASASASSESSTAPSATTTGTGSALLLVDASESVDIPAIAKVAGPLLDDAVAGDGHRVAVWNYSSPQTEGVVNSVRSNVLFEDGTDGVDESVNTLNSISAVGQPWLWRSVLPTYEYAVSNYVAGMPNRIVLLTTGQDDSGDDAKQALESLKGMISKETPVAVEVIVLKDGKASDELKQLATLTGGSVQTATDYDTNLGKALTKALGL